MKSSFLKRFWVRKDVLNAVGRADFLVRDEEEFDCPSGRLSRGKYRQGGEDRTDEALLIVFDAATVYASVLGQDLERIGLPHRPVALGDDVEMAHDPNPASVSSGTADRRDDVWPRAARNARVGRVVALDLAYAFRGEPADEGFGFPHLALPARLGGDRGDGGEQGLELDDARFRGIEPVEGFLLL